MTPTIWPIGLATGAWSKAHQGAHQNGCGATVGTVDDDILSGGVLPIASNDKFASKERGHEPNDIKVVRAAACGMHRVAALAGGGPAAGMRHSAKGVFVLALSGNNNAVAASADYQRAMQDAMKHRGHGSGLWSMPSDRRGLGWAGRRHKPPSG
jgi:hypothetical protein